MLALLVCRCLRSDAVTAPRESLWLRHNQKIRTTLETLSSKSTKSTLNPCLQTRANHASVKWQIVRKAAARTVGAVYAAIGEALQAFTPEECANYLKNSGYRT